MYLYYFLAAVSCWFGIQSLLGGFRFAAYVRRETSRQLPDFHPFVSVIVPGRGLEPGLAENLRTLLTQDYPAYEVLFVFDREDDPAIEVVEQLIKTSPLLQRSSSLVQQLTAGRRSITCALLLPGSIRNLKCWFLSIRMLDRNDSGSDI